jgi:chemotaxis-related protein WspD
MSTTSKSSLPAKPSSELPALAAIDASSTRPSDCWNTIGVAGDRSCARLEEIIHCHNCPGYAAAGVQLFNQALPPAYRREMTQHYAQPKKLPGTGHTSVLLFRIGPEWLALPTSVFQEVVEHRTVHSLPHRSRRPGSLVLGVVNIRGQLVLCVSVGRLLNLEKETRPVNPALRYRRLLVAIWNGQRLAFPVDEIHGIHRYCAQDLEAVPAILAQAASAHSRGVLPWRGKSVGCLDEEPFFAALNRSLA